MPEPLTVRLPVLTGRQGIADELKGLAMILLVLFHAGGVLGWNNYLHGDLGTDIFLIVSGACLALTQSERPALAFLRCRLWRILPAFWIVYTAYLILHTQVLGYVYEPRDIAVHYLGIHAFFGDAWAFAVNDSFWFVTPILFYYLSFVALRPLLERLDVFWAVASVICAIGAFWIFFTGQGALMGRWGFRMPDFFLGMMIGHGLRQGRLRIPLTPWLGVALVLLLYVPYSRGIVYHPGVVGLAVALVYVLLLRPGMSAVPGGRFLTGAVGMVGRHSLEIFLIHQPLLREYNRHVQLHWLGRSAPSEGQLIAGMAAGVGLTLLLAVALHAGLRRATGRWRRGREEAPVVAPAAAAALPSGGAG